MPNLNEGLDNYLRLRRQLGFKLDADERTIRQFIDFLDRYDLQHVSLDHFNQWFKSKSKSPIGGYYYNRTLMVIRLFSEYWVEHDKESEPIPREIKITRYQRSTPHIYSDEEMRTILLKCFDLYSIKGLRKHTFYTAFGLIMTTGIRRSEALNLNNSDINLDQGIIHIIESKYNKSRALPIHQTALDALKKYSERKNSLFPQSREKAFFVSEINERISKDAIGSAFRTATVKAGLRQAHSIGPRIHDMRHTFAVNTLTEWLRNKEPINKNMPILTAYLGHKKPSDTYWYLSSTKELLSLAMGMKNDEK